MRYIIKGTTAASLVLEYDENELLSLIEFKDNTAEQINYMLKTVPVNESDLEAFIKDRKIRLHPVQQDLSFKAFWNAFKYKVGKKVRAERLWNSLTEMERELVFLSIPRYHRFIVFKNQNSAYAETWLSNRMWENEYILK